MYAEADPFVIGDTSYVLAHFSHLNNFKPLDSAKVSIMLNQGGQITTQTLNKPTRVGIYRFSIAPVTEGMASLIFRIEASNLVSEIRIDSMHVFSDKGKADNYAMERKIESPNGIVFTKEQSWKIDFATSLPDFGPFGQVIRTTAQVLPTPSDVITVVARTSGVVNFTDASIVQGTQVAPGRTLCLIAGSALADNNSSVRYFEAKNNFIKAEATYNRHKELAETRIISQKELDNSKAEYENAKSIFESISKNFNPSGQSVTSPISGFIDKVSVTNGQFVETGQAILSISKNKNLLIRADVQQKFAPHLQKIETANIRNLSDNIVYTLEELNGKLLSYGKSADERNYLIPVIFQVESKTNLMPGGFVDLYLKTLENHQAISVPNAALLEENGNHFVFVQLTPELFEKREVMVAAGDGFRTEIKEGLSRDERIITKGTILVKLAQSSGALDAHAGHVH